MNPGDAPVRFVGLLPMVLTFGFSKINSRRSNPLNPGFEHFKLENIKFEGFKPGEGQTTGLCWNRVPNWPQKCLSKNCVCGLLWRISAYSPTGGARLFLGRVSVFQTVKLAF